MEIITKIPLVNKENCEIKQEPYYYINKMCLSNGVWLSKIEIIEDKEDYYILKAFTGTFTSKELMQVFKSSIVINELVINEKYIKNNFN